MYHKFRDIVILKLIYAILILFSLSYVQNYSFPYEYDQYSTFTNKNSILDTPMLNSKTYRSKSILPKVNSIRNGPINHFSSNNYEREKSKSDLITSTITYNEYSSPLLFNRYHHQSADLRHISRLSRQKSSVINEKSLKDLNDSDNNPTFTNVDNAKSSEQYSNVWNHSQTKKHNITYDDQISHSGQTKNISSREKISSYYQEIIQKEREQENAPLLIQKKLRPVEIVNHTLPLLFQNMTSRDNSIKFVQEPLDSIMNSSNVSTFYKNSVTGIFDSENPSSTMSSTTKLQNLVQNITLSISNASIRENDDMFEETLELPNKSNLLNNFGNSSRRNSISSSKNQTMQSSDKMRPTKINFNSRIKTGAENDLDKNESQTKTSSYPQIYTTLINGTQETLNFNNSTLKYDVPDYSSSIDDNLKDSSSEMNDKTLFIDSPIFKSEMSESYEPPIYTKDENTKIFKIISSLDMLMGIINSRNYLEEQTKLPNRNQANRISDIEYQEHTELVDDNVTNDYFYDESETTLPASIPLHLVPLGPDGEPLFDSLKTDTKYKQRKQNITKRFPFLNEITTTLRPPPIPSTNIRSQSTQNLIGRVLDRMTQDPDMRDTMLNGMLSVAPIAMLAIMSSVDLPALLLAPFAAVLPTFLFGSMGDSHLSVSPTSGVQGSHNLNLTIGGMADDQSGASIPQPPDIVSNDPLADEMAETLYPHLHSLIEFFLG